MRYKVEVIDKEANHTLIEAETTQVGMLEMLYRFTSLRLSERNFYTQQMAVTGAFEYQPVARDLTPYIVKVHDTEWVAS